MAEEKFDIRQWLLDADTTRLDESLDEEAKRLLVLNDALVNPDCGPILATLIVTAEQGCGLDALPYLADCSEPRLAMIAIVNILTNFETGNLNDSEFIIPDASSSSGNELSISRDDLPSHSFVRSKVAQVLLPMSQFFVDRVDGGDFCPDFLSFLLTSFMDLTLLREGKEIDGAEKDVMLVPTEQFLKTILRVWKTPELCQHCSESEDESSFNLGFIVTCYIKSLCMTRANRNVTDSEEVMDVESRHPTGAEALIKLGDWAVKFILMRLYSPLVTASERSRLIDVMNYCASRSEAFTNILIRESALTALSETAGSSDSNLSPYRTMSSTETMDLGRTTIPSLVLLNHLSDHLMPGIAIPGSGIWFDNKQSRVTLLLCRAFTKVVKQGMRMVILSTFPSTEEGRVQNTAVFQLVSCLVSHVWKAGIAVLFRIYRNSQRPLREQFLHLFEYLGSMVETFCRRRNLQWEEVSRLNKMATLRVGVNACKALKRNTDCWERMKSGENVTEIAFIECDSDVDLCEWCLAQSDTPLMACGQCRQVSYCCVEHQRAHWTQGHKVECRFFRNCLEGSSFSYSPGGKLCGLKEADEDEVTELDAPFGEFAVAQSKELLVLGYRMPGVMLERRGLDGTSEVFYKTKGGALRTISEFNTVPDTPWESTINNLLITEALMSASRGTASMLYILHEGDRDDTRTFSLHCATSEYSQSLSVKLLP